MNVLIGNSTAWNTMLGSSVGMSAICGSGTAMDIMVNNEKCIQGMVNSDMVMGLVVNNDTAMNCILRNTQSAKILIDNRLSTYITNPTIMNKFAHNKNAMTAISDNINHIKMIAQTNDPIKSYITNSPIAISALSASKYAVHYANGASLLQLNNINGLMVSCSLNSGSYKITYGNYKYTFIAGYVFNINATILDSCTAQYSSDATSYPSLIKYYSKKFVLITKNLTFNPTSHKCKYYNEASLPGGILYPAIDLYYITW